MERPIFKPVGTPVEELDTPALVVDLATLERNIETVHSFFRQSDSKVRPHVDGHRCPAIAHMQLSAGGTAGGVCTTTVGQAEVFAGAGFTDIFVANVVVTPPKITRLVALARRSTMTVAVDNTKNVGDLSEAASAAGVDFRVVVDINTRLNRGGVQPGQPAVDLAKAVADAEGLTFAGLMTYEGAILADSPEELEAESRKWIQQVLDTRQKVEGAGIDVTTVSVGGTYNYETAGSIDGVTEVPAGSYALMDQKYRGRRGRLEPAARIMATVGSIPQDNKFITDAGNKAVGADLGPPVVDAFPGASIGLSAEHGGLTSEDPLSNGVELGDKIWFTPWDIGSTVNHYDYIRAVRNGRLEAMWDVSARGHYR